MRWYYYPQPSKPIPVENGIKTKNKHGEIGEKWWSKRWIEVLESFNIGARLQRGRSYARKGQVLAIDVQKGTVMSKVQGSIPKPYSVRIQLEQLSDREWNKVTEVMATQALFAAKLLAGEMPKNIEEAFSKAHVSLFPKKGADLDTECSCPDWSNPCKHIAAVYYLLAEHFDEDPFLIFKLRGKTKEEIIQILRKKRGEIYNEETEKVFSGKKVKIVVEQKVKTLEESMDTFWKVSDELESFKVNPTRPEIGNAILRRLGEAPFKAKNQNVSKILSKVYKVASEKALKKVMNSEDK